MEEQPRTDYRSINKDATILGIERRLCILIGMSSAVYLRLSGEVLKTCLLFSLLWGAAYLLTLWESRLLTILRRVLWQKRTYCPFKFTA